jgi:hypothetical protein
LNSSLPLVARLRGHGTRALALGAAVLGLTAAAAVQAEATDHNVKLGAGLGPYVTPATGVIANDGVTGTATVDVRKQTADVTLTVRGLKPMSKHAAHLHVDSCVALQGHFRYDPNGPATRANEVWLDLTADRHGKASAEVDVRALDVARPLSVVIHQGANPDVVKGSTPGKRIACGGTTAQS